MKRVLLFLIVLQLSSSQRCPVCKDYYCLEDIWKDCSQTMVNSNITNISNSSINCISVQYIEAEQEYRQLKDCVIGTEEENCQLFYQEYGIQNVNCTVVPAFVDIQPSSNQLETNGLANGTNTGQGLNLNLNCSSPCLNLNLSLFLNDNSYSNSSVSSSESLSYSYDETLNVSYLNLNFSSNWFGNLSFNSTEDSSDSSSDLNYSYDLIFTSNSSVNLNESDFLLSNLNPVIISANPIPIYNTSLNQSFNFSSSEEDSSSDLSSSYDWNSNSSFNLTSNETDFLSSDPVIISSNPVLGYRGNLTSNSNVSFTSTENDLGFNYNSELNSSTNLNLILNKNYSLSSDSDIIISNATSYKNLSFSSTEQESNFNFNPILQSNSNLNVDFNVSQASVENNNNSSADSLSSNLESFLNSSQNLPLTSNSELNLSLNSSLKNLEQPNVTEGFFQTNNYDFDKIDNFSLNSTEPTLTPTEPTISLLSFFNTTLSDPTISSESPVLSTTSDFEFNAETNRSLILTDLSSVSSTLPSDSSLGPFQDFSPTSNVFIFDGVESNSNENDDFDLSPNFTMPNFSSNTDSAISSPFIDSTSKNPSFALSSANLNSTNLNFDASPTLALDPNFSYNPNQSSKVTPTSSFGENYSLSITYTSPTSSVLTSDNISSFDNFNSTLNPILNLSSADNLDVISSFSSPTETFKISLTTTPTPTQTSNTISFVSGTSTQTLESVLRPGFATRPGFSNQNSGLTTPTSRSNSSFRIDPNISFSSSSNSTRSNFTSNTTSSFYSILRDIFNFNVSTTPSTSFTKKLNVTSRPHPLNPSHTSSLTFNWIPDRHFLPFLPTPSVNGGLKPTGIKPKKLASHVSPDLKPSPDSANINTVNVVIEILVLLLSVFELR